MFIVILWFITYFESDKLRLDTAFSVFKIIFEMSSAYGTCGLSMGYRDALFAFVGAWTRKSQFLLTVVMLMGRHRGLPDSIDPSVRLDFDVSLTDNTVTTYPRYESMDAYARLN